jgi:aspartate racemase
MKTMGLLGGMSWESSLEYYRIINETTRLRLGGLHSAPCILVSVDFAEIEVLQQKSAGQRRRPGGGGGGSLERAGADFVVLCTNTMHLVADELQAAFHSAPAHRGRHGAPGAGRRSANDWAVGDALHHGNAISTRASERSS